MIQWSRTAIARIRLQPVAVPPSTAPKHPVRARRRDVAGPSRPPIVLKKPITAWQLQSLSIGKKVLMYFAMTETFDWKKERLSIFARDAVQAKSDHRRDTDAVIDRTARLRMERLEREAVIHVPAAPPRKAKSVRIRKSVRKTKSA